MFVYETQVRVRYAETDQMGYVYYGNYATFFEVARVEMLRSLGTSYKQLEEQGIMMPVTELNCKYIRPAKYDELLTIRVTMREMPHIRIRFEYEVFNEQGKLTTQGDTQLAFVDSERKRPCPAPEDFLNKLAVFFTE
jgi:acyl-CoA thioester hydrolase